MCVLAQVTSSINNLIIGKIYIDHGGMMRIRGSSGLVAKIKFHETGMLTREAHQVGPPRTWMKAWRQETCVST